MATNLKIHTKSNQEYIIPLESKAISLTPDEAAEQFFKEIDFSNFLTLRLGKYILFTREIECFEFQ